jgi:hypothetical protein
MNINTNKELYELIGSEAKMLKFLVDNKLVEKRSKCPNEACPSKSDNRLVFFGGRLYYKCNWYKCTRRWSVNSNIFNFNEYSKLTVAQILEIIWFWSWNTTALVTAEQTKHSYPTILGWFKKIRDVCELNLLNASPMGGPGWEIQIDESLFQGRRKYNRGRLRKGDKKPKELVSVAKLKKQLGDRMVNLATNKRNYGNRVSGPWVFGLVAQKISDIQQDASIK